MAGRLCVPVDAYMLLERDGKILMLRRAAAAAYAAGLLCPRRDMSMSARPSVTRPSARPQRKQA